MKLPFLLFLLLSLVACGNKSKSNKRETPISQNEIEEVMANQQIDCASTDGSPCPAGVARLLIVNEIDPNRSGACTGFMISPTRLVTNHHCVSTQPQCLNTYIAIYNGNDYVQAKCSRILKTAQDVDDPNDPSRKLDYTIMSIDRSFDGEYFKLSDSPASNGDQVHAWVIDHTGLDMIPGNLFDSRVTEFRCRVSPSERESLLMVDCPIISGNSGSPILNSNNEVVGVIWGGTATTVDSSYDLDLRRELNAVGLATEVSYFRNFVEL